MNDVEATLPKTTPVRQPSAEKRYETICSAIHSTDEISFRLLGLVPLFSGAVIVAVLKGEASQGLLVWLISAFGAVVTLGIFRWELRNIQNCKWLVDQAAQIERNEFGLLTGQFAGRGEAPRIFGLRFGKTEAEKLIYIATILAWLALPWAKPAPIWPATDNSEKKSVARIFGGAPAPRGFSNQHTGRQQ